MAEPGATNSTQKTKPKKGHGGLRLTAAGEVAGGRPTNAQRADAGQPVKSTLAVKGSWKRTEAKKKDAEAAAAAAAARRCR